MSMLAGPRRKQKLINLRAKNNAWSNDNTKFGQRMLEKMGWSSGKGLGARENGIVEHVIARYKNDDKGLGFEDKNDQWTKHDDDFNALLANLSNSENDKEKLHSGVSLEDKSKKSKVRVHYHKFTRGKDLTRYSAKDLANIFGKKSFKQSEKEQLLNEEPVESSPQKFTEKGSMEDYFKNKLAAIKKKSNSYMLNKEASDDNNEADFEFRGFSGTTNEPESDEVQGFGFQGFLCKNISSESTHKEEVSENVEDTTIVDNNVQSDINQMKKKNKKKKKSRKQEDSTENECVNEVLLGNELVNEINIEKSKKSKKRHKINSDHEELLENIKEIPKKKSKKPEPTLEIEEVHSYIPKKKKKRKNKDS